MLRACAFPLQRTVYRFGLVPILSARLFCMSRRTNMATRVISEHQRFDSHRPISYNHRQNDHRAYRRFNNDDQSRSKHEHRRCDQALDDYRTRRSPSDRRVVPSDRDYDRRDIDRRDRPSADRDRDRRQPASSYRQRERSPPRRTGPPTIAPSRAYSSPRQGYRGKRPTHHVASHVNKDFKSTASKDMRGPRVINKVAGVGDEELLRKLRKAIDTEWHHIDEIVRDEDGRVTKVTWGAAYLNPYDKRRAPGGTAVLHHKCRRCKRVALHLLGVPRTPDRYCLACDGHKDVPDWYFE
eukprot:TRINITY_DN14336_c0_g1_i1.p1 TRINITY_DN14336_c0_g1~~TRINITY_DN14336_c0_g1_i1.p1  ORF type:complete len:296 (+),score=38.08 TRINITY_DN14336_c0_g1_i1:91-978(+)